jgi:hypothetical protein
MRKSIYFLEFIAGARTYDPGGLASKSSRPKTYDQFDLTQILFLLLPLIGLAQLFGWLFVKIGQPKVIGEMLDSVVLGNAVLGRIPRGGPGIVLASVTFDAGIISSRFYTTLVVAAVLTSQIAGT